MPQPIPPIAEIESVAALYNDAVARGLAPMGIAARSTQISAISEIVQQTGLHDHSVRRRLKHAARLGLINVPPHPAPGFEIRRRTVAENEFGAIKKQWVQSKPEREEVYQVPDGMEVVGETPLLDESGRVITKHVMVRKDRGRGAIIPAIEDVLKRYQPRDELPPPPEPHASEDLLSFYPIFDLHMGQLSWPKETGDDYNIKIATDMMSASFDRLVRKTEPGQTAVVLFGGDYFHSTDKTSATPRSKHPLDTDGRWPKVFDAGAECAIATIERAALHHPFVEVAVLEGNHDEDAIVALRYLLHFYFLKSPRISVSKSAEIAWYRRHGLVLLGATHGHTMKPQGMVNMLVSDRAQDWGQTKFRHFFFGHIHHETAREIAGVRVESFQSPAGKDSFNAAHGYRSGRSLTSVTFHTKHGEDNRQRVNIV